MKKLLKISLDDAIFSFVPVLQWLLISIIIDKNLINIFSLVYPVQFIWYILKEIFGTGANISKEKDKNKDAVMSGMLIGSIIGLIIFWFLVINVESYLTFMNMDVRIYKKFTIYYFIQLYLQLIFAFVLEKLYYEDKTTKANIYCLICNLLNFIVFILGLLFIENEAIVITITLTILFIFVLYTCFNVFDKFELKFKLFNFIKYNSVDIFNNLMFFFIFLFGLSNAMEYGEQYALALTFVALITDSQWDALDSISTVAKIDVSQNHFNYKNHIRNSYIVMLIYLVTSFFMFIILYKYYDLNLIITLIYLSFEIVNFVVYPIYNIKTCFLQLEYSALKTTTNKIIASTLRLFVSFLKTPFCTGIGQLTSAVYQLITINIMFKTNFKIDKNGEVIKK